MGNFFSNFVTDFISRFDGPLHFRLFVQPSMQSYSRSAMEHGMREKGAARTFGLFSPILTNAVICSKADGRESPKSLSSPLYSTSFISLWSGTG